MAGLWLQCLSYWAFMALTADSQCMSPHHMVLFLVLINGIFQDHVKLGTEGFSVAASSALCRETLPRAP